MATRILRVALALCSFSCASLAQPARSLQTLFEAYKSYPPCYRQPVLVVLDERHLIAFAEGRNNTSGGHTCSGSFDGHNSSIRLRRSADGGTTWSAEQELFHGQPDYLSAVYDKVKGRVHLFIMNSPNLWTYSDDKGSTWSPLVSPKVSLPEGVVATPGVAHGIQLTGSLCHDETCEGLAGRLLVAWVCHKSTGSGDVEANIRRSLRAEALRSPGRIPCAGCYSCLAYSDDAGETWRVDEKGLSGQEGTREASLAQVASSAYGVTGAVVYASERNMGQDTGHRLHAISIDGGTTFSLFGSDPGLPDSKVPDWTGIVAGVTRFDGPTSSTSRLVLTTPRNKSARADMTLFASSDEGRSWSQGRLYRAGPAGYSDAGALNATHAAILFENGDQEFAERISFGYFTAEDLLTGRSAVIV